MSGDSHFSLVWFPQKLEMLNSEQPYQNLKPLPDGRSERCRPQAGRPETGWNHKGDCAAPRDLITDPREERPRVDQALLWDTAYLSDGNTRKLILLVVL